MDEIKNDFDDHIFYKEIKHKCVPDEIDYSLPITCSLCGVYLNSLYLQGVEEERTCRTPKYQLMNTNNVPFYYTLHLMLVQQLKVRNYSDGFALVTERNEMIDSATEYCRLLNYSNETLMTSVYYIDIILSNCQPDEKEKYLLAKFSVIFAAKLLENCMKIPTNTQILDHFQNDFKLEEIQNLEMALFGGFDYNFCVKTSFDFMNLFLSKGVLTVCEVLHFVPIDDFLLNFENKVKEILMSTSCFYRLNKFPQSVIASIAIAITRTINGLKSWTDGLELLTTVKLEQLQPAIVEFVSFLKEIQHELYFEILRIQNPFEFCQFEISKISKPKKAKQTNENKNKVNFENKENVDNLGSSKKQKEGKNEKDNKHKIIENRRKKN